MRFLLCLTLLGYVSSFLPVPHVGRLAKVNVRGHGLCGASMVASVPDLDKNAKPSLTLADVQSSEKLLRANAKWGAADMDALFVTCPDEVPSTQLEYPQGFPKDLPGGALLRIGPNPRPTANCDAFFDGDGMVHAVSIPPPESREDDAMYYSRAWVRAKGFSKEEELGEPVMRGTLVAPKGWPVLTAMVNNVIRAGQPVKDTVNTAISVHGGKLLARMEQCRPSEISVSRKAEIRTLAASSTLDGSIPPDPVTGGALGAHTKEDTRTGQSMCFTYNTYPAPTGVRYDVRSADGALEHSTCISMPVQTMVHDLAITDRYTVLLDLPLTVKPIKTIIDSFPVAYERDLPSRIGLVPRLGDDSSVMWFDIETCVVLHTINAYERDDGTVVVRGFRYMPPGPHSFLCEYNPAYPYEWVLDINTGKCVSERYVSTIAGEFPTMHPEYVGRKAKYSYGLSPTAIDGPLTEYAAPRDSTLYGMIVKYDLDTGEIASSYSLPKSNYIITEGTCVPKIQGPGKVSGEDECYLLYLSTEVEGGKRVEDGSRLLIFDAADLSTGPVAAVKLPHSVPYGLHSAWVPWAQLK